MAQSGGFVIDRTLIQVLALHHLVHVLHDICAIINDQSLHLYTINLQAHLTQCDILFRLEIYHDVIEITDQSLLLVFIQLKPKLDLGWHGFYVEHDQFLRADRASLKGTGLLQIKEIFLRFEVGFNGE